MTEGRCRISGPAVSGKDGLRAVGPRVRGKKWDGTESPSQSKGAILVRRSDKGRCFVTPV
jgi:hypothetical protein